jgi:hypothetical protein
MNLSDTTPAPTVAGTSYIAAVHRTDRTRSRQRCSTSTVAEQPVNLPTAIYLSVFIRAEQRVLQSIFKAFADGGGKCVAIHCVTLTAPASPLGRLAGDPVKMR